MEFWGVEVKAGQPLKVKPEENHLIHLSQASLGESKKEKGHGSVPVYVKLEDKKLVLGTLIPEKIPQLSLDLIFEQEFELSHNSKNGSIYFMGYQTPIPDDSEDFIMPSDDEEEEELPGVAASYIARAEKAKPEKSKPAAASIANAAASIANAAKSANLLKDVKAEEDDDEDESDDDDYSDEDIAMGEDSDEISGEDDDSDDDEDDSEDEDEDSDEEETPKKAEVGKKRPTESAVKTPVPTKKAKSPMTDGKKGGHVATPHPSKGVKTPNAKPQTPKSGRQVSDSSNSKGFKNKAKHSAK